MTIRRYVGTGYEQAHGHPVVFDSRDKVVRLSLQKGRREKLSDPLPRTSPEFAAARGGRRAGRRFRFGQPEQQQGSGRGNADGRVGYTPVVSMLSERVVLRVLLMLAEWASAKSTTTIDDKIVTEIRTKLEADGKL